MVVGEAALVGRETELRQIRAFLDVHAETPRALVLEGEAGIGKTVLLEQGLELARSQGLRVLRSSPGEHEQEFSYAGLVDLFAAAVAQVGVELAPPRRRALEVALVLADPDEEPPDPSAIALGLLDLVRALAAAGPVAVVVDDLQWLDAASAAALGFAVRRLDRAPLTMLVARRGTGAPPLGLEARALSRIDVGPLSVGALHRVLVDRLRRAFSRPVLAWLHETSGGNPFHALELARALARHGVEPRPGQPLPLPDSLDAVVGDRLASLSPEAQRLVAKASLLARPTKRTLGESAALDEALAAGILSKEDDDVRFTHPLLAAAARTSLGPEAARRLHVELATTVREASEGVRHRALAAEGPDEEIAQAAEAAAAGAAARGARSTAASLLELALSLTPDAVGAAQRRTLALARELTAAGSYARARVLLERLATELVPGGTRSDVLLELGRLREDDIGAQRKLAEQALAEADIDERRASAHSALAHLAVHVGDFETARGHARSAADLGSEESFVARALGDQILLDTVLGAPVADATIRRALALDQTQTVRDEYPASLCVGLRLMYQDRHDEARELMLRAQAAWQQRGIETSASLIGLAQLEARVGRYQHAGRFAAEALALAEQDALEHALAAGLYVSALVDAYQGRAEDARAAAERAVAIARGAGEWVCEAQGLAVLGLLELSLGRPAEAAVILEPLARRLLKAGLRDPSVWVGALPDAVEALIAIGELDRARELLSALAEQGAALPGPWTRARAARAGGLLHAAEGRPKDALEAFARAQAEGEIPLERGRTLLAIGSTQRHARQRKAARETLQQSLAVFEELGAELWAQRARELLGRIGGRAPSPGGLTPTERRVAGLVAEGKTNREVATEMVVSVHTVEAALTAIYRKLGVRSRTEMARKLMDPVLRNL
jgi:DNA-binding CsgD family transcriptional regulator